MKAWLQIEEVTSGRSESESVRTSASLNSGLSSAKDFITLDFSPLRLPGEQAEKGDWPDVERIAALESVTTAEAFAGVLEKRGLSMDNVAICLTNSRTPLPAASLKCSSFALGGQKLCVKRKRSPAALALLTAQAFRPAGQEGVERVRKVSVDNALSTPSLATLSSPSSEEKKPPGSSARKASFAVRFPSLPVASSAERQLPAKLIESVTQSPLSVAIDCRESQGSVVLPLLVLNGVTNERAERAEGRCQELSGLRIECKVWKNRKKSEEERARLERIRGEVSGRDEKKEREKRRRRRTTVRRREWDDCISRQESFSSQLAPLSPSPVLHYHAHRFQVSLPVLVWAISEDSCRQSDRRGQVVGRSSPTRGWGIRS